MSKYIKFIESKGHYGAENGIPIDKIPNCLSPHEIFEYQSWMIEHICKYGRYAGFIDTGLGKTIIELILAQHYAEKTNKPTLILTPLAVAYQFQNEAEKFGVADVSQTKDGKFSSDVVTCNYERIHHLNPDDFGCVILDESSILKSYKGHTKSKITDFLKNVLYRFLFTATPAPNDFIELGTSSEALGYMGHMDMLSTFFTNKEKTSDPARIGSPWYLKPHAEDDFFSWVNSWSVSMKKPSCIGFTDGGFELPDLIENNIEVDFRGHKSPEDKLTFQDIRKIQKESVGQRCEIARTMADDHESSVFWVHRNDESETLKNIVPDSFEIKGSMSVDKKEDILIAFSKGEVKKLITKPTITGFGLNWQHCNHTCYFPTYSYEQYYQSIRRFWRFGQKRNVMVDRIYTLAEHRIIESLQAKAVKADKLYVKLNEKLNSGYEIKADNYSEKVKRPVF